ncbi:hypothetical protein F5X96DRAFT_105331 [Biscogniauxia mediterranea]|nr:hypothetical protein F5X96DRAFT_105331 [Biscogniauxia mediterranea]
MNNASSPTSPADPLPLSSHHHREDDADDEPQQLDGAAGLQPQDPSLSQKAKEGLAKKLQFLSYLTINLDTMVHAELCVLYYMDCSFFRLMIRWVAQALFVSPKAEDAVLIIPNYHVSAIVGPNILCMFLHLVTSLPQASEASRGYLHGGILIDFVGQKAPSSKLTLLLLDLLVLALQCFMVTVNMEKERIRKVVKQSRRNAGSTDAAATLVTVPHTGQDHDAEERGVLRDAPMMDETSDIEMDSLLNNGGSDGRRDVGEGAGLLPQETTRSSEFEGLTDILRSGNAVLANFNVRQSLRTAWHNRDAPDGAAAYTIQNVGYNATLAALAAQRRARLAAIQQTPS